MLSVAAFAALAAGLRFTPLGRRIRATVQNRPLAESAGISTRATDRLTFFLGSGLAGVAGVAVTLTDGHPSITLDGAALPLTFAHTGIETGPSPHVWACVIR